MAVLCLLTNTPWPWPTPAGAASARGGVPPPLERSDERSGGGVAQRRSAQAQRGRLGCLLSRARDTHSPQQAWLPCISVKRRDCFGRCSSGGRCGQGTGRAEVDGAETFVDTGRLCRTNGSSTSGFRAGLLACSLRNAGHPPTVRPFFAHRRALRREVPGIGLRLLVAGRRLQPLQPHQLQHAG
jgi:hypothetical protein